MGLRVLCYLVAVIVLELVLCYGQTEGEQGVCVRPVNVPKKITVRGQCKRGVRDVLCTKSKKIYVTENRQVCCSGWLYNTARRKCTPVCRLGCKGGNCVAPDTCECDPPLILKQNNTCEEPQCDPSCVNANCVEDDKCLCNEGFTSINETHCAPVCQDGFVNDPHTLECMPYCDKCDNGTCTAPNTCTCADGYVLKDSTCEPKCVPSCKNGDCIAPNTCACREGFNKDSSDISVCHPICENPCVNATCVEPNTCDCLMGYEHENPWVCKPKCESCSHGECVAPNQCMCSDGYFKADGVTCAPICSKSCVNGNCSAPETCSCSKGYELDSNDTFKCNPICRDPCVNAFCSSPETCTCYPGFEKKNNNTCIPMCTSCSNGICVAPENCQCNDGFERINGTCKPVCSSPCVNGYCESLEKCACNNGYLMNVAESLCYKPCIGDCENGICNVHGICLCNSGYELYNNSCVVLDNCEKCNGSCSNDLCSCNDGRPCQPSLGKAEAAQSTSLASLQITWVLGGCVGILLVTIVIVTIGYLWRKRKVYVEKPTDNGNMFSSVLYTNPNTLIKDNNYGESENDFPNENDEEETKRDVSLHLLEAEEEEEEEKRTL